MKLRDDLVLRHLGNEHVVVEPGQGMVDMSKVYTLNNTGALLWETLKGKEFSAKAVLEVLLANYKVDESRAAQDACALVEEFEHLGLLID